LDEVALGLGISLTIDTVPSRQPVLQSGVSERCVEMCSQIVREKQVPSFPVASEAADMNVRSARSREEPMLDITQTAFVEGVPKPFDADYHRSGALVNPGSRR
jgi:hypothetical protein